MCQCLGETIYASDVGQSGCWFSMWGHRFFWKLVCKSTAVPVTGTSYTALHHPQLCVWGKAELQSLASLTRYQTG